MGVDLDLLTGGLVLAEGLDGGSVKVCVLFANLVSGILVLLGLDPQGVCRWVVEIESHFVLLLVVTKVAEVLVRLDDL